MYCKFCNKPLNESQYSENNKFKSCPRCSILHRKEHVFFPYPQELGTTAKRESEKHPDGSQSYCTRHRANKNSDIQYGQVKLIRLSKYYKSNKKMLQ